MKPPSSNKGASNPYARRTPWGRVQAPPFQLGARTGAASVSGEPPVREAPPLRQARGGALPNPGEGILGGSPLMPARAAGPASPLIQPAEAKATPIRKQKSVPTPKSAPTPAIVAPAAMAAPPAPLAPEEIIERLAEIERPAPLTGRRLLIGGVALGVIALIGMAALVLSRRDAGIDEATPYTVEATAPAANPDAAPPAAPDTTGLPAPPIYRATLPPPPTGEAAPMQTDPTFAPPAAPVVAEPVLAPPEAVAPPPVVEAPAPKPAPPPAPPRPAADPDSPFVLRKGEG